MSENWIDDLPTGFMSNYLAVLMHLSDLPGHTALSKYNCLQYFEAMGKKIQQENGNLLHAKTKDDVATAESRKKMFEAEREMILSFVRKNAVHVFLKGGGVCVGHLDGRKTIIPRNAWSGEPDWENGSLYFNGCTYSQIAVVKEIKLSKEKWKSVKEIAGADASQRITRTGAAGRPSSMHVIEIELRRRIEQKEAEKSMMGESKYLASWLKEGHPDLPPVTPKGIANKLGKLFRALKEGRDLPKI
jgi:hypothetical protein